MDKCAEHIEHIKAQNLKKLEPANLASPVQGLLSNLVNKPINFRPIVLSRVPGRGIATFTSIMNANKALSGGPGPLVNIMDALALSSVVVDTTATKKTPESPQEDPELEFSFDEAHGAAHGNYSPVGLSPTPESGPSPKFPGK